MCVDRRELFKDKNGDWFHKKECAYNPFIAKWEGEDDYLSLKNCGIVSDYSGFAIDNEVYESVFKQIWNDQVPFL
jgi:hypothetical protein